ncbi:methyl coenzyme M reductase system, component A2 [Methanosphaera cuniculi]|uniref:methyl coenzyme M reductase system, component A2 n=1 Tax=Methanosphaera cuniculi TaxID=1077256 RepID=UPI0026E9D19A|nr:methyl coenzyme M reductase system, component A2 [Methanosphaera cuniculi]
MSFIEVKNVTKKFDDTIVLEDISLNIEEGEVLGILGKSGSGKSVLLNMLRGIMDYAPDEGDIIFNVAYCPEFDYIDAPSKVGEIYKDGYKFEAKEINLYKCSKKEFAAVKRRISIMLQRTFALYEEETVLQNIMRAFENQRDEDNINKAIKLLKMTKMEHRITHIARDLSGGEKQRIVLARQLAKNPMLFLADEPTGTLDPKTAQLIHDALLDGVKEKHITMVINSHWPEVIQDLSDRVIWLDEGKIKDEGTPEDIVPEFVKEIPQVIKHEEVEIGEPIIKMEDLKKYYFSVSRGVVKSVDGVTLTINEGEIASIVGLSGAGKTTLSKLIAGLIEPSEGDIEVRIGDDWVDMSKKGLANRGRATKHIGLLHQDFSLYPYKTILGNLTDGINLDLPPEFAKMKSIHVLTAVGFTEEEAASLLEKYPDQMSGGEKHRVAIAQVLIKEPTIVILDEPTGTMDPITRRQVTESILNAREELDQTFVIISHDMDFVLECCDTAALMRDGKLLDHGKPEKIVEELTSQERTKMLKNAEY